MTPVSLRNHSQYSLLRALPQFPKLLSHAQKSGYTSLALTDTMNMYGAIDFYKDCKKKEIKPILGVEFKIKNNNQYYDLILLAKNFNGYQNLMKLVSIGNTKDKANSHPHITLSDFRKDDLNLGQDIIALSGGPWGELSIALKKWEDKSLVNAKDILKKYQDIFGANFYIEITNHIFMDYGKEMRENTIRFARENNLQLVATMNTHYLNINDKPAHKTLVQIDSEIDAAEFYKETFSHADFSFKDIETFTNEFSDIPDAIENTHNIAEQINLEIPLGAWVFPDIEYKKSYDEDLRDLAYEGLNLRKMDLTDEVRTRLDYELEVIKKKGYSPYFLVVYDLLRFARENNILTNIRGSVAGSLVTYLLRITKCDPFMYKLPFERFLNPERPSAPDIDMDYADDRRDDVLNYSRKKYGADHVAQIGTFGTMMARAAVRDVARAMNFPYIVGDRISKMIPPPKQGFPVTIESALEDIPELKTAYDTDRETTIILDMARELEGTVRHIGVHAAGTVIGPRPITDFSPIQYDPKGEGKIITQYDMNSVNEDNAGLLKFDFLGIRNLSILGTAIDIVKNKYNIDIDIEEIPLDDAKTFEMLAKGYTEGVFQLSGSGMTKFLKELRPSRVHDLNAMVALYRPGPLEMIPEYIKRKHNPELIEYLDSRLEPILDQSFGVIVYQDDVMLIAIHLAGYSWLEADKLRKAMGKKIPAEMAEQKEKLFKGFEKNGLSKEKINELWSRIEPFAAYGFNKAHAASYGRVAYQTAYMKANYPHAYMTAIMTHETNDLDKIADIVAECKRMNIKVLAPNINYSMGSFEIFKNENNEEEIRFGLYAIKNFGTDIADAIIAERNKNGIYKNLEDLLKRVTHKNLNKKSLEALAMSGALDDLAERNEVIENMEAILDYHKSVIKDNSEQSSLFDLIEAPSFKLKKVKPAEMGIKLNWEKELLGLYISGFPLDKWKSTIEERKVSIEKIINEYHNDYECVFACIIEKIKITKTKKGDRMALLTVRDYTTGFEVAVFPKVFEKVKERIVKDKPVLLKGKVAEKNGDKTFVVDEIKILE